MMNPTRVGVRSALNVQEASEPAYGEEVVEVGQPRKRRRSRRIAPPSPFRGRGEVSGSPRDNTDGSGRGSAPPSGRGGYGDCSPRGTTLPGTAG